VIETEQTVAVARSIDDTWAYAKDFQRWASIMPGYQSCEIENEDNSLWILKVGIGAMIRTIKVRVHVKEWAGPRRVDFSFDVEGDPVLGAGTYHAVSTGPSQTDMTLRVQVEGSGPMAAMWEAMGRPMLPKFAKAFAEQLKDRIEAFDSPAEAAVPMPVTGGGLMARLRALWSALFGQARKA
jgi:carbon monoxide dehydrogenase subunit G